MTRIPKALTSDQKLRKIVKELDPMELVCFMERIHLIINATDKVLKETPEQMSTPIVHYSYYKSMVDKVKGVIG